MFGQEWTRFNDRTVNVYVHFPLSAPWLSYQLASTYLGKEKSFVFRDWETLMATMPAALATCCGSGERFV